MTINQLRLAHSSDRQYFVVVLKVLWHEIVIKTNEYKMKIVFQNFSNQGNNGFTDNHPAVKRTV